MLKSFFENYQLIKAMDYKKSINNYFLVFYFVVNILYVALILTIAAFQLYIIFENRELSATVIFATSIYHLNRYIRNLYGDLNNDLK